MKRKNIKNSVLAAAAAAALILTGCQSNAGSSAETEALREQIARLEQQISDLEQRQAAEHAGADSAPGDSTQQSGADAGTSQPTDADTIVGNQSSQNDAAVGNQSLQNDMSVGNQPQQNDTNVGNGQLSDSGTSAGNTQPSQNDTGAENAQPSQNSASAGSASHTPSSSAASGSASSQQGAFAAAATTYTMEELESQVNAFAAKVDAAVPGGNASEDMEQFFALKQEEKRIDDLLDQHEDELEYLYKRQSLTRDAYKQLERELELLEDRLDIAEDQLEFVFGIDD